MSDDIALEEFLEFVNSDFNEPLDDVDEAGFLMLESDFVIE